MLCQNHFAEPNQHVLTSLHPILICRVTYWALLELVLPHGSKCIRRKTGLRHMWRVKGSACYCVDCYDQSVRIFDWLMCVPKCRCDEHLFQLIYYIIHWHGWRTAAKNIIVSTERRRRWKDLPSWNLRFLEVCSTSILVCNFNVNCLL
jgi:hypothetical protein